MWKIQKQEELMKKQMSALTRNIQKICYGRSDPVQAELAANIAKLRKHTNKALALAAEAEKNPTVKNKRRVLKYVLTHTD